MPGDAVFRSVISDGGPGNEPSVEVREPTRNQR